MLLPVMHNIWAIFSFVFASKYLAWVAPSVIRVCTVDRYKVESGSSSAMITTYDIKLKRVWKIYLACSLYRDVSMKKLYLFVLLSNIGLGRINILSTDDCDLILDLVKAWLILYCLSWNPSSVIKLICPYKKSLIIFIPWGLSSIISEAVYSANSTIYISSFIIF